jgi:hypothetical protein
MLIQETLPALGLVLHIQLDTIRKQCVSSHCLEDKSSAKQRGNEDNGSANERCDAKFGTQRRSSAFALCWCVGASRGDGTVRFAGKVSGSRAGVLATCALETRALSAAILEVVLGLTGVGGKLVGADGDIPGAALSRALGSLAARLVTTITARGGSLSESVLEGGEVGHFGDLAVLQLDETVVGFLLRVFVDETSRVDRRHVGSVDGRNLVKLPRTLVAAVLRQAIFVSAIEENRFW